MKKLQVEYTDAEIISRIAAGETPLFEMIVRRYNAALYKTGRACGYTHDDTQDLMQESFINAYLHLGDFRNQAAFKTWLLRIMLNNCFRKRERLSFSHEIAAEVQSNATPLFSTQHNDTDRIVTSRELNSVIEHALRQVPAEYRMVFSLREVSGLNVQETAEVLNISEANVKVRLTRAKSMLRKEIERTYSPDEIFEFNLVYCDAMVNRVMSAIAESAR